MSRAEIITDLTIKRTVEEGRSYYTPDAYVLGYNSITFNVVADNPVVFKVYGGHRVFRDNVDYPPVIIEKTLESNKLYSRTIDIVSNNMYVEIENDGVDSSVQLDTIGSYSRNPNALVRQHNIVDSTNNIQLTKDGSTYFIDLSRGILENQEPANIVGSAFAIATVGHVLWDDQNNDVYDGLSIGVSCQVLSSSALDAPGNIGGVCVKVSGLVSDFSKAEETIELNGINPVILNTEFMRINRAEITKAGTGLVNQGVIEINPLTDTSLIMERIAEEKGISSTFHYTVPKNEELIITDIDLHGAIEDPTIFDVIQTDVENPGVVGGGTPVLKKSLKYNGVANGEWSIYLQKKFTEGQNIKLDIQSNPLHGPILGINTVYATTNGVRINTIL